MSMRALVTGAGSGIGRATCLRLARDAAARGARAQIAAVDLAASPGLPGTVEAIEKLGAEAFGVHGDMGTADGPGRVVSEVVARFGGLDGLVSNAGVNRPGLLKDYDVRDWDLLFAVNVRATWLLAKAAHDALATARGAIVVTASMSGSNAHANLGAYGPSKAAVIMLMRVLAQEFGRDGVRVNAVSPGMIATTFHDTFTKPEVRQAVAARTSIGREGTAADVANAVLFLASGASAYITGESVEINGGLYFV